MKPSMSMTSPIGHATYLYVQFSHEAFLCDSIQLAGVRMWSSKGLKMLNMNVHERIELTVNYLFYRREFSERDAGNFYRKYAKCVYGNCG